MDFGVDFDLAGVLFLSNLDAAVGVFGIFIFDDADAVAITLEFIELFSEGVKVEFLFFLGVAISLSSGFLFGLKNGTLDESD